MFVVDDKTVKIEKLKNLEDTQRNPELNAFMKKEWSKEISIKSKKKIMAIMGGGFIAALLIGYFTLSYYHDKQDIAENERMHKKQIALQEKETAKKNFPELGEVKTKAEKYFNETVIQTDKIKESLDEVKKGSETVVAATQNTQVANSKIQAFIMEHQDIIDTATQFIQIQKKRFSDFFSEQNAKAKADKNR